MKKKAGASTKNSAGKPRSTSRDKSTSPRPRTVLVTFGEAARMPSKTNVMKVKAKTDAEIARDVASDPDAAPIFTDEMFEQATWVESVTKQPISFRVDRDVLAFFKRGGAGYQSRMNAVLRAYVKHADIRR